MPRLLPLIRKWFFSRVDTAVRNIFLSWLLIVFSIAAGKRALGYGPARPENWATRRRHPAEPAFAEDDAPSLKCLQLTSCLEGSIEKLMQPSRDGQGWCGFCSVCKRPLEVRVADGTRSVRHDVGTSARGRYAFLICLWGSSKDYVLGALVLGFSIKRTRTKHSLVCLHTEDVSPEHLKLLQIFWDCRLVEHIEVAAAKRLSTDDFIEESRFFKVFTKLRALEQVDFEKVLVMDIDLLVLSSVDKLFELPAPAALKRGMNRGKWPYKHGDDIDGTTFFSGSEPDKTHSWGQGTGINAGVMLLAPNMADFLQMQAELREPWHPGHVRGNGPEQDYLSRFFADRPWRHISVENNFQVHHMFNALHPWLGDAERLVVCQNYQTVRIVHFSGDSGVKPWTRCLQKSFGWPSRDQDEEYMQSFLSDHHSYLLWVKKDPERWSKMERNMFDDSSLRGFSLGQDGAIYFEDESGKVLKETSQEAITAVMDATRYFLKSWFDMLEAAGASLQRNLVEELISDQAVPSGSSDPWQGRNDPWQGGNDAWRGSKGSWQEGNDAWRGAWQAGDDAWRGGKDSWKEGDDAWRGGRNDSWQEGVDAWRGGKDSWQEGDDGWRGGSENKSGSGCEEIAKDEAWSHYNGLEELARPHRPKGWELQQTWPPKKLKDYVWVECITLRASPEAEIRFLGRDFKEVVHADAKDQEIRGLYVKDATRAVRNYSTEEEDLKNLGFFVDAIQMGDFLLCAAMGLEQEALQKVLKALGSKTQVPHNPGAMAVAWVRGRKPKVRFGPIKAFADTT
ncbi:unnamed protein product [Durusdinium trenchii]|uniref:Uncharacterized protein n=1 Tax=Durusdinium trenchii TaxID=1381693 RepID=A0ABP0MKA2_9DINO